jgi:large subunit ribosomal protein L6
MSRIGKKPIPVPAGVTVNITPGCIDLKGPLGTLQQKFPATMKVELSAEKKIITVTRPDDEKQSMAFHGLTRALINNAVKGVVQSYEKSLDIVGTGYNAKLKGKHLELQVGFFLPQTRMIPEGLQVTLPNPTKIVVKGCDKQLVGQFAASVRAIRPPDPYKGKGVRYSKEIVKLKASKAVGGGASKG